jgi:DNA-directed RNA polymerase specialized sigma24 family protein
MTDSPSETRFGRRRWELTGDALERLLLALDSNRESAAHKYEALRRKLIDLFAWERSENPEDLADETLNRLARRILEGVAIPNPDRYAFGISRLVLMEEARLRRNREGSLRDLRQFSQPAAEAETIVWLRQCLETLPGSSRDLIERYYSEDREFLARSKGLSLNALRNRVMRIREQLYECVCRKRDIA